MKHTILRSVWAAALVAVAVISSPPSVQAQSDPPPGMTLVTTGVPTFGSFFSLSGNPALLPMPFDVMPWCPLYVSDSDTNSYIYYIDDRGLEETLADVNSIFAIISSPPGSGVMVRGGGVHADDDGPPVPEGDEGGGGSGSGGPAQGGIAPPGAGYTNCLSYTNFWLISAPGSASNVISVTISNTISGLSYLLLEKGDLGQSAWFTNTPLTASGSTVSTNINIGTNQYMFFNAMLTTNDQAPTILAGLTNQVVNSGGTATFYVTATGLEPLSYYWYLNGTNIPGADTNSLTVSGVTSANAGIYTVVVSNAICEADASATLSNTWSIYLTNAMDATPAVGPFGIFVPDEYGNLFCLDAGTGNLKWATNVAGSDDEYNDDELTASVVVSADGSAIYVGTQAAGGGGSLLALNPTNAHLIWSNNLNGGVFGTPALASDGTIYVGTWGHTNAVFAVNPANGEIKWSFQANDPGQVGSPWDASPAIEPDGSIVLPAQSAAALYSIHPDGSLKWLFPIPVADYPDASVAIDGAGNIFISDYYGYVYCLGPDGGLEWIYDTGIPYPIQSSIALGADGTVYAPSEYGILYAITNGSLKWQYPTGTAFVSSPAVTAGNVVVTPGYNGTIYALTNGAIAWTNVTTNGLPLSSPAISPVDGGIFVAGANGFVYKLPGTPADVNAGWPMFHQNARHWGGAYGESGSGPGVATAFPNNPTLPSLREFDFYVSGTAGSEWAVYASTNLVDWTNLSGLAVTLNASGYAEIQDTGIAGLSNRCYQLVSAEFCSAIIGFTNEYFPASSTNLVTNPFFQADDGNWPANTAASWVDFLQGSAYGGQLPDNFYIMKSNGTGYEVDIYEGNSFGWLTNGDIILLPGQPFYFGNPGGQGATMPFAGLLGYDAATNLVAPCLTNWIAVTANPLWTDTGMNVQSNDAVIFPASGVWSDGQGSFGPGGSGAYSWDTFLTNAPQGSLVAFVGPNPYEDSTGSNRWGQASYFPRPNGAGYFEAGATNGFRSDRAGRLWFGFNADAVSEDIGGNAGSVNAQVTIH